MRRRKKVTGAKAAAKQHFMAVYTQLTDAQIAALMEGEYALGRFKSAHGITQGVENTNYRVLMERADGVEVPYILTLFEKRTDPKDLPFFIGLMEHLAGKGVSCPAPMARQDGQLCGEIAGKPAVVISFLQGVAVEAASAIQAAAVGDALAQMHVAVKDFAGVRANALSLGGWKALYDGVRERLDTIEPKLAELIAAELSYLETHWPAGLPQGVIHADLFPDNVFFRGDEVSGLIDFYFACNDVFAYDLAITMNAWCFDAAWQFDWNKSVAMLVAYQRIRVLNAEEKAALPILLRGAALRFLLTRAHDFLHQAPGAQVVVKDPREYLTKLQFHQQVASTTEFGA